jgi:hypothetical protein
LTCNCCGVDINSTYRQCLVSMRNSTIYFTALTLFDTGAYTSFVNREVAKWLEQQQHGVQLQACIMSSPAGTTSLRLRLAWQAHK